MKLPALLLWISARMITWAGDLILPLTLDPAAAELTTTLCVQGECSSDTHPLEGDVVLALRGNADRTEAMVSRLHLTGTALHNADLNYGFGGRVTAALSNLVIQLASPPSTPAWSPVEDGWVTFRGITNTLTGHLGYTATGLACALVQTAGLTCLDVRDLSQRQPNVIDTLVGRLGVEAGRARWTGAFTFREPIVPNQPSLGEVRGAVSIAAIGDVRPVLAVRPLAEGFELRWNPLAEGFVLERTVDLASSWQPYPADPVLSDNEWVVQVPRRAGTAYFRLRRS